ncbi:hypothetical protein [Mucilaginibacter ginsenosidivorax]|uniref:hypothetical protein n=1 Tax=Mucilaginibacter ginsenosidivorax TaxID=862126 RepID=UPI0013156D40|nr:hypothetical protein [Mucilaginibacter ginsenosidivorax]
MPTTIKKATSKKSYSGDIINDDVKSYADEPYFVKKTEEARATLKRVGLPGQKKK